jgi:hypothetical protein
MNIVDRDNIFLERTPSWANRCRSVESPTLRITSDTTVAATSTFAIVCNKLTVPTTDGFDCQSMVSEATAASSTFASVKQQPDYDQISQNASNNYLQPKMNLLAAEFNPSTFSSPRRPRIYSNQNFPVISDQVSTNKDNTDSTSEYKKKVKTELCKFWARKQICAYGDECAFAHGEQELQKKVHVTSHYKMSLCQTYHSYPFYCLYGERCQFAHLRRDFSDFHDQKTPYQNLLSENVRIMSQRIEQASDPDITVFNVAKPTKARLKVFQMISAEASQINGRRPPTTLKKACNTGQNKKQQNLTRNEVVVMPLREQMTA